jgi:hypothetical protein
MILDNNSTINNAVLFYKVEAFFNSIESLKALKSIEITRTGTEKNEIITNVEILSPNDELNVYGTKYGFIIELRFFNII